MSPAAAPRASVLLPVRDGDSTLERALASLFAQRGPAFEIVAVDDGSRDGSAERLADASRRDPRLRLLSTRPDGRGLVAALNLAVREARAPLLARMDADDVSRPDRLRLQVEALQDDPTLDLISCRVDWHGAGRAGGYARHVAWLNDLLSSEQIANGRFVESPLAHPSVCFRRDALLKLGGYRHGDFPEDYELWLRWLDAGGRMRKLPETLLDWHDRPGRLSRVDPRYRDEAFQRLKAGWLFRWLEAHNPAHPRVRIWGAGRDSRRKARWLQRLGVVVEGWVDIDPRKLGQRVEGTLVEPPEALPEPGGAVVLVWVARWGAREEIAGRLEARGWRLGEHWLPCA